MGGRELRIGPARILLSFKNTREVLYVAGHALSTTVGKRWSEITEAMLGLVEIVETMTDAEAVREWAQDLTYHHSLRRFDSDDPACPSTVGEALSAGHAHQPIAIDKDGRIYIRLVGSILESARERLGQSISQKTLADRISEVGFTKLPSPVRVRVPLEHWKHTQTSADVGEAKTKQVSVWMSPKGLITQETVDETRDAIRQKVEEERRHIRDREAEIRSFPRQRKVIPF